MVPASRLLEFAAIVAVVIAIPGPSVLFTISRALTVGRRSALLTVIGNAAGEYGQVIAVAFGVGVLVQRSAAVFTVVKLAGAVYLVYLGTQAFLHRRSVAGPGGHSLADRSGQVRPGRAVRDGFVVGAMNPKTIVFLVVVLPGFTDRAAGHLPLQMLLLGALFPLIAVVLDSIWALAASSARAWLERSPGRLALIGGTGGLMMAGLGVSLALTGRKD